MSRFFLWNYSSSLLTIILPIGLSFHTFQSLSYVIEVYRKNQKAEKNFLTYALYVMFFPQLVAGPIERPQNVLHQFYEKHDFDYNRVVSGLKLMAWGMFKKVVVADRLAVFVNAVYNNPTHYKGTVLLIATIFFAVEIYADFSGYSDIAIGSARVIGFRLMLNFNKPYYARSISEFWKRWHISLSSWFRDYLYIPLGGNRVSTLRCMFNTLVVFLISGLWHGTSWTFVAWGALHGLYSIFSITTSKIRQIFIRLFWLHKLSFIHRLLQMAITFCLVTFAWIFFRANSFADAFYIIQNIYVGVPKDYALLSTAIDFQKSLNAIIDPLLKVETDYSFVLAVVAILFMEFFEMLFKIEKFRRLFNRSIPVFRWSFYFGLVVCILMFGYFSEQKFIYYQF